MYEGWTIEAIFATLEGAIALKEKIDLDIRRRKVYRELEKRITNMYYRSISDSYQDFNQSKLKNALDKLYPDVMYHDDWCHVNEYEVQ